MTDATVTDAPPSFAARVNAVVRRIIGAPDYASYLRHVTEHHPDITPLTEAEFLDEQLTAKYSKPGSRCC
jgi:uncharacterized short protein YbdD (DUF466 family)